MKKDRLYTVNRWNRPAFMSEGNIFDGGGDLLWDRLASKEYGADYGEAGKTLADYKNSTGNNWFGLKKKDNPFSKGNIGSTMQGIGTAVLSTPAGDKMLDTFDPMYHIAGGRESAVGNSLNDMGKGVFKAGVSTGNPWLMAGGAGLKIAGGLTNAAFGSKMNKENIADVEKNISGMRESANVIASSSDTGSLLSNAGKLNMGYDFGNGYIGKDGWFSNKAKKKAESLRNQQNVARGYAAHALNTGAQTVDSNTDRMAMSSFAAFGGPLDIIGNDNMGAIGYGLMSDYMNMKNTQAQGKNNTVSYLGALPSTPLTYSNGGGIHIKKSHEGLFTEQANRAGMGVQEYAAHVLANKDRYPASTVRRANFARNASHWHSDGGYMPNLFYFGGPENLYSDVDNRSDTTRKGEGEMPASAYGAAKRYTMHPVFEIMDILDRQTNMTRPDSPIYNAGLIAGDAPAVGGFGKAKNALEALQKIKEMKAAKAAAQTAKKAAKAANYTRKSAEEISATRRRAAAASVAARQARQTKAPTTEAYQHRFDAARARNAQKEKNKGLVRSNREATKLSGNSFTPYMKGNGKVYNYGAIRLEDMQNTKHGYGGFLDNNDTLFALGGDLQTNGSDWSDGLTLVNAGGSHESNPNQGVQMGLAPDNTPNLVEEGETIFNDYVFSNRIHPTNDVLKQFHMYSKGGKLTYADVSKRLEKEAKERPNDPISAAALKKMLEKLAEAQENQKAEEEAERARKAFEALTPEEQQQVIAQITAQQQAEEQQAQEGEEVPVDENGNPVEQPEQPVEEEPVIEQPAGESGVVGACGGMLNHKFAGGGKKNVGTWKDPKENHWDKYTRPGLEAFLSSLEEQLKDIPADDMRRTAIINGAINDFNTLQQSYYSNILNGNNDGSYSDAVLKHQQMFDKMKGNTGYYTTDANGNITNLISEGINTPNGAATEDIPNHWADGYNGPRTSIRNFGSTEYGDSNYYKDLTERFAKLGINYSPNENWKYGDNNSQELYALSLADAQPAESAPKKWDWNKGNWTDTQIEQTVPAEEAKAASNKGNDSRLDYKDERWRYAGIFGPAIGLGLWGAGVGKPDNSGLDAALRYADASGDAYASYTPFGQYRTYTPFDIWSTQIAADKSKNATDLAIRNNGAPVGTTNAALVANDMAAQEGTAKTMRQAKEYNDALAQQVLSGNNALAEANAKLANNTSLANAEIANKNRQYRASLAADIAAKKQAADAQWYNALYGNIGQMTNAIAGIGNDNMAWNQVAGLYNVGALGRYDTRDTYGMAGENKKSTAARGGKLRKKKKRGLTY